MITTVRNQVARLEPIKETVILTPMTGATLAALEAAVGFPIPGCVREYLQMVGLKQDLTSYHDASEYEVYARFDEFVEERKALVQLFGDKAAKLFPFAGDGAGDCIAAAEDEDCSKLIFADHETRKIRELGTFCQWLEKVVDGALRSKRPLNHRKRHYVQFSFRTQTPEPILTVLSQFAPASVGEWTKEPPSPSGVDPSHTTLTLGTQPLRFGKLEYWTWDSPMFSFDFDEAATLPASQSQFQKLDEAFRKAGLGYKLVDYGILDSEGVRKAAEEEAARKAALAVQPAGAKQKSWWQWW
jgi:hypothetical protein